jgi:SAM-dependent methyltransferase
MQNPWLNIPLADYEAHMASPSIVQAQMLAAQFELALKKYAPKSVAVFGCAGGNGLERIDPCMAPRVVAIDINPDYIEKAHERFAARFRQFEPLVADVQSPALVFKPVDMIYAALIFEYVDSTSLFSNARRLLNPQGVLVSIVQLPGEPAAAISPSPYASLMSLVPLLRLISPDALHRAAADCGFESLASTPIHSASGKPFQLQTFRRA